MYPDVIWNSVARLKWMRSILSEIWTELDDTIRDILESHLFTDISKAYLIWSG